MLEPEASALGNTLHSLQMLGKREHLIVPCLQLPKTFLTLWACFFEMSTEKLEHMEVQPERRELTAEQAPPLVLAKQREDSKAGQVNAVTAASKPAQTKALYY